MRFPENIFIGFVKGPRSRRPSQRSGEEELRLSENQEGRWIPWHTDLALFISSVTVGIHEPYALHRLSAGAPIMELDITEILARLPHRPPMLLVDRVLELIPQERIVAIKHVSARESFFSGHSDCAAPCMPAALILESMAQSAALFSFAEQGAQARPEASNVVYYFLGVDDATFMRPVVPGDCLCLEVQALRLGKSICKYLAKNQRSRPVVELVQRSL